MILGIDYGQVSDSSTLLYSSDRKGGEKGGINIDDCCYALRALFALSERSCL